MWVKSNIDGFVFGNVVIRFLSWFDWYGMGILVVIL